MQLGVIVGMARQKVGCGGPNDAAACTCKAESMRVSTGTLDTGVYGMGQVVPTMTIFLCRGASIFDKSCDGERLDQRGGLNAPDFPSSRLCAMRGQSVKTWC